MSGISQKDLDQISTMHTEYPQEHRNYFPQKRVFEKFEEGKISRWQRYVTLKDEGNTLMLSRRFIFNYVHTTLETTVNNEPYNIGVLGTTEEGRLFEEAIAQRKIIPFTNLEEKEVQYIVKEF